MKTITNSLRVFGNRALASPHVALQWALRCCADGGLNSHTFPPQAGLDRGTAFRSQRLPLAQAFCFFYNSENQTTAQVRSCAGGADRSLCPVVPDLRLVGVVGRKYYEGVNHNTRTRIGFSV